MTQYLVKWEINIYADTAEEAAQQALDIQRDPDSKATVFTLHHNGLVTTLDLKPSVPHKPRKYIPCSRQKSIGTRDWDIRLFNGPVRWRAKDSTGHIRLFNSYEGADRAAINLEREEKELHRKRTAKA